MMSGPYFDNPEPMPALLIRRYREMFAAHADNPQLGACPVCDVAACDEWRWAAAQLIISGELPETKSRRS
jgi:hypothetical protein